MEERQKAIDAILKHPRLAAAISTVHCPASGPARLEVNGQLLTATDLRELADRIDQLSAAAL